MNNIITEKEYKTIPINGDIKLIYNTPMFFIIMMLNNSPVQYIEKRKSIWFKLIK